MPVAKDQIRMATMEEAEASDTVAKDLALTADRKYYQDMTGATNPAPRRPRGGDRRRTWYHRYQPCRF